MSNLICLLKELEISVIEAKVFVRSCSEANQVYTSYQEELDLEATDTK